MELELTKDLKACRIDRPDEWTMDRFIRKSERLKKAICIFVREEAGHLDFECDDDVLIFIDQYAGDKHE